MKPRNEMLVDEGNGLRTTSLVLYMYKMAMKPYRDHLFVSDETKTKATIM